MPFACVRFELFLTENNAELCGSVRCAHGARKFGKASGPQVSERQVESGRGLSAVDRHRQTMKLQMFPVTVETTDHDEVRISQPGENGSVRISVEQVAFLVDLLHQARSRIEDEQNRRSRE